MGTERIYREEVFCWGHALTYPVYCFEECSGPKALAVVMVVSCIVNQLGMTKMLPPENAFGAFILQ